MDVLMETNQFYQATIAKILIRPSWDIALLLGIFAILFFYGLSGGKRRIASMIVYMYVAIALLPVLPIGRVASFLRPEQEYLIKAGAFLLLSFLLPFLLGSRGRRGFGSRGSGSWWQVFILCLILTGFLAHLVIGFLPAAEQARSLSPLARSVFAGRERELWWMLVPLAAVAIMRKMERL